MPAHEQLVLLLDELNVQVIIKTDKGYIIHHDRPNPDGMNVDMEDFR